MSVFGNGFPFYKLDDSVVAVEMNHSVITKDNPQTDILVHESDLGGERSTFVKGERWLFEVRVNLFKDANPGAVFKQFYADKGKDNILLYRNLTSDPIQSEDGYPVYFTLSEVMPGYLQKVSRQYDTVILRFTSNGFVSNQETISGMLIEKAQTVAMNAAYTSKTFRGLQVTNSDLLLLGCSDQAGTYRIKDVEDGSTAPIYYTVLATGDCYKPAAQPFTSFPSGVRNTGGFIYLPVQSDKIYSRDLSLNTIAGSVDDHNIPNYFNAYYHQARNLLYVAAGHKGLHIFDVGSDGSLNSPIEPGTLVNYQGQYLAVSPYGSRIAVSSNFGTGAHYVAIFSFDGSTLTELSKISFTDANYPRSLAWDRFGHLIVAVKDDGFRVYDIDFDTGAETLLGSGLLTRDPQISPFHGDIVASYNISSLGRMRVFTMKKDGSSIAGEQLQSARAFKDISPAVSNNSVIQIMEGSATIPDLEIFKII